MFSVHIECKRNLVVNKINQVDSKNLKTKIQKQKMHKSSFIEIHCLNIAGN